MPGTPATAGGAALPAGKDGSDALQPKSTPCTSEEEKKATLLGRNPCQAIRLDG